MIGFSLEIYKIICRITKPAKPTIRQQATMTHSLPPDLRTDSKDFKISQRGVWKSGKITLTWWVQNRDSIADAASWRPSSRKQTNKQTLRPEPQTRARAQRGERGNKREKRKRKSRRRTGSPGTPSALILGAYSRSQNQKPPASHRMMSQTGLNWISCLMCVLMDEWMNFISSHW